MPSTVDSKAFRNILLRNVLLPLGVGIISCGIFVLMINQLLQQSREVEHSSQIVASANENLKLFIDGETGLRGFVITRDEAFLTPYQRSRQRVPAELNNLQGLVGHTPAQIERVESLRRQYAAWVEYAEEILASAAQNRSRNVSDMVTQGRGKAFMDRSREIFEDIIKNEETRRHAENEALNQLTIIILSVVSLFSLLSSAFIAFFGRKQILDLSGTYETVLRESENRNEVLRHQQWLKTGQSELNDKMAAEYNIHGLCNAIVSYTAQYLKAQAAALYLLKEDAKLARMATYAYTPAPEQKAVLHIGEGLVGEVARERRPMVLDNLPPRYLQISSGLGDTASQHVMIVPFVQDNQIQGVLELGFLSEVHPSALDFYKQIEEGVSVAISSAQFREQREKLLKEIQNQAEELQTQQEELRVTNEELEEQTRMLKETHARLEAQQTEMEQTNSQLEEQTQTLESQKDMLDKKNQNLFETKLALEQKASELQRASQYKSEFLANMSHELRTPLNSSLILAKLLADNKDGNLTNQQVDFARQIQSSGNDLLTLINDILDLSKVESGKLDIMPENITVADLVAGLQKAFGAVAKEKKLKLSFEVSPDAPATFFSDKLRVEQVLKNLLSNALKFTSEGEVSLKIHRADAEHIAISVRDTGIGIHPDQQEVIFEAFRQADGTTNRKFGGTGLGLSISRNLAYLLGGSIKVESQAGQGSVFTLTLPEKYEVAEGVSILPTPSLAPMAAGHGAARAGGHTGAPGAAAAGESNPEAARAEPFFADDRQTCTPQDRVVLVVEDDKKFAGILYDLAHELKYKCIVTDAAEEAVQLTHQHHPVAILLDITLTDRSGLYVLDQLKQQSKTRHIPIHVISATDFSRQALHMGAMGYILKPVKRAELVEAFGKIEEKIRQDIRKVLVVEDNEIQREAIQKLIGDKNLETTAVETGARALEMLAQNSFDCMIVDLNLPDMSGFDLLEKMNNAHDRSYPPVIVYTGRDLSRDEEAQLNRYSQSVIIKGAKSPERLLDEVTLFLHRVESDLDVKKQVLLQDLRNRDKVFENRNIMVVDDDMRNIFALTAALEQKGARVIIAKNGQESLNKLESEKNIDIVLMDIMMPVMDGYQAIREIRKMPEFKKLPIIALTAKAMKDDQQLCLQAGANDYLSKPVELDKLLSLARIWLMAGWR